MVLHFEFPAVPSHHIGRFCLFSDFRSDKRENDHKHLIVHIYALKRKGMKRGRFEFLR